MDSGLRRLYIIVCLYSPSSYRTLHILVNGSYLIFTCTCWQPSPLDYDHFDCALEHSMCAPVNLAMYRHCKEQMTFHLLAHTGVLHLLATHWLCIGIILIVVQSTVVLHQLTCQQLISGYWFALGFCTHWLCIGIILILVHQSFEPINLATINITPHYDSELQVKRVKRRKEQGKEYTNKRTEETTWIKTDNSRHRQDNSTEARKG